MISAITLAKLSSLNVDRSSGHPKPHKVCLLFAVMDLIKSGAISKNEFVIDGELKDAFSTHFDHLKKGNDVDKVIQPFYHLHSDGIWHFQVKSGKQEAYNELINSTGTPSIKALFEVIDYAYLDDELYAAFQNEKDRNSAKEALLENLEDLSVQFERWLKSMGKSEKTATNYAGAIRGSISKWANDANISQQNIITIQSYSAIHSIAEQLAHIDVFIEKDAKGKHMYSCALKSYQSFLADTCQVYVAQDIEDIINDETIDSTQKSMLVNTRVGQGKFREKLIKYWKGCAVTGYASTQFLVASHIKPWRDADDRERLDQYNGILLLPNLDKVFDLGFISFEESGEIIASDFIESPEIMGLHADMKINIAHPHQDYLAYHREHIFEPHKHQ